MTQPTWLYLTCASASKRAGNRSLTSLTIHTLLACRRGARGETHRADRVDMQRQGAARAGALRLRLIIPGEKACRRAIENAWAL